MGVPTKVGAGGIEEIVEVDLSEQERTWLEESAAAVRDVVGVLTVS
jgi:malate dehydrogenase